MSIFLMFFLEIMTMRYGDFGHHSHGHNVADSEPHIQNDTELSHPNHDQLYVDHCPPPVPGPPQIREGDSMSLADRSTKYRDTPDPEAHHHVPGDDHLGHSRDHRENPTCPDWDEHGHIPETYAAQMTGIFILEFGIIFHSIFIGLTLAVSGAEFVTLYIILVFHQTFEGLGLGARLATVPWPKSKRWSPYLLGFGFGITTPIAIAVGLGVRNSYPPESETTLIVNGVFDSISAGILIYTGLVELMAHEFMFSPYMQKGPVKRLLGAFGLMCLGAGMFSFPVPFRLGV
jgi:zinc transporter 1/2/3